LIVDAEPKSDSDKPWVPSEDDEQPPGGQVNLVCSESWPSKAAGRTAVAFVICLTYVTPLALIIICYVKILRHLTRKTPSAIAKVRLKPYLGHLQGE